MLHSHPPEPNGPQRHALIRACRCPWFVFVVAPLFWFAVVFVLFLLFVPIQSNPIESNWKGTRSGRWITVTPSLWRGTVPPSHRGGTTSTRANCMTTGRTSPGPPSGRQGRVTCAVCRVHCRVRVPCAVCLAQRCCQRCG